MAYFLLKNELDEYTVIRSNKRMSGAIVQVPGHISKQDHPFVKARDVVDQVTGVTVKEAYVDEDAKALAGAEKAVQENKVMLDTQYYNEIGSEMSSVFGTTNRDTATSLYLTWLMMESKPEFYSDKGLEDEDGNPLDTNTKVHDYAADKLMRALDYSVFLLSKRKQLKIDKQNLE